jgi:RNA polymerase sigma-70 factor (ECF subfamily)
MDSREIVRVINLFLAELPENQRNIFLRRYWHLSPIGEIAAAYHMSESRVTSMLFRHRKQLRELLQKEGIDL